jgi:hypothetical protein
MKAAVPDRFAIEPDAGVDGEIVDERRAAEDDGGGFAVGGDEPERPSTRKPRKQQHNDAHQRAKEQRQTENRSKFVQKKTKPILGETPQPFVKGWGKPEHHRRDNIIQQPCDTDAQNPA